MHMIVIEGVSDYRTACWESKGSKWKNNLIIILKIVTRVLITRLVK